MNSISYPFNQYDSCDPFAGASVPTIDPSKEVALSEFAADAYADALRGLDAHARIHGDAFTPVKPVNVTELRREEVDRLKQIGRDFFPIQSSPQQNASGSNNQSSSLFSIKQGGLWNTNYFNLSICSGNSGRKKEEGMSPLVRGVLFVAGAAIVVAGNIFLGKSQKLIHEAQEDLTQNEKGTDHVVRTRLNIIDRKIIDITKNQQKFAGYGVVCAVAAIAAAAFASYTLMWAALIGGVGVIAFTVQKYFSGELDLTEAIKEDYYKALFHAQREQIWS